MLEHGRITGDPIVAESEYDHAYRFRVWRLIWDDMCTLDMGYRAYHSRIMRFLEDARSSGTSFQMPNGTPITLDTFTRDDLYGFLGKRNEIPKGPGRNLANWKFVVLDCFVKSVFPHASYGLSDFATKKGLAHSLSSFYSAPNSSNLRLSPIKNIFKQSVPIVPTTEYVVRIINSYHKTNSDYAGIPIYFFEEGPLHDNDTPGPKCILVYKFYVPAISSYFVYWDEHFNENRSLVSTETQEWLDSLNVERIDMFEGIGLLTETQGTWDSPRASLLCMMRHRSQYTDYITLFSGYVHYYPDGESVYKVGGYIEDNIDGNTLHYQDSDARDESLYNNKKFMNDINKILVNWLGV